MKNKFLILSFVFINAFTFCNSQIVLDTVFNEPYPYAMAYNLIRLEKSGLKWLIGNNVNHTYTLLNLDYSLFKQFSYQVDIAPSLTANMFYMTETLFDNDSSDIEFVMSYYNQNQSHQYFKIWDEAGNLLFFRDSAYMTPGLANPVSPNILNGCITNTDSGAIMVVYMNEVASTYRMEVYKLPGHMPCSVCKEPFDNNGPIAPPGPGESAHPNGSVNAFPNPSADRTTIDYNLPQNYTEGTMRIIDMKGNVLMQFKLSNLSHTIAIEKGILSVGVYSCIVEAGGQVVSKKFIRID